MSIARCPKCHKTHHCYTMHYSTKKSDGSIVCIYDNGDEIVYTHPEFGFSFSSDDVDKRFGLVVFCSDFNIYIPVLSCMSVGKVDLLSDDKIDF